jgi:hypothetical protein
MKLLVSVCVRKQDLLLSVLSNGAWSHMETSGAGDWECFAASCSSHFSHG